MKIVSFKNALALKDAGHKGKSEKAYVYQVESHKVKTKKGKKTITETWEDWDGNEKSVKLMNRDSMSFVLSNRFTDSWTDDYAPAYNAFEILKLFPTGKSITADADPDKLAKELLRLAPVAEEKTDNAG